MPPNYGASTAAFFYTHPTTREMLHYTRPSNTRKHSQGMYWVPAAPNPHVSVSHVHGGVDARYVQQTPKPHDGHHQLQHHHSATIATPSTSHKRHSSASVLPIAIPQSSRSHGKQLPTPSPSPKDSGMHSSKRMSHSYGTSPNYGVYLTATPQQHHHEHYERSRRHSHSYYPTGSGSAGQHHYHHAASSSVPVQRHALPSSSPYRLKSAMKQSSSSHRRESSSRDRRSSSARQQVRFLIPGTIIP